LARCFAQKVLARFVPEGPIELAGDDTVEEHPGKNVYGKGCPQVPWKPWWSLSVLFDPGRIRQAVWTKSKLPDTAPACVHDEGSRRLVLSGLNHTTFDLTVYAWQDGSPHHHARLASGCWSSFARRDTYPQGFSERFQSSSLFLLPKAYLTQGHHTCYENQVRIREVVQSGVQWLTHHRTASVNSFRPSTIPLSAQYSPASLAACMTLP